MNAMSSYTHTHKRILRYIYIYIIMLPAYIYYERLTTIGQFLHNWEALPSSLLSLSIVPCYHHNICLHHTGTRATCIPIMFPGSRPGVAPRSCVDDICSTLPLTSQSLTRRSLVTPTTPTLEAGILRSTRAHHAPLHHVRLETTRALVPLHQASSCIMPAQAAAPTKNSRNVLAQKVPPLTGSCPGGSWCHSPSPGSLPSLRRHIVGSRV